MKKYIIILIVILSSIFIYFYSQKKIGVLQSSNSQNSEVLTLVKDIQNNSPENDQQIMAEILSVFEINGDYFVKGNIVSQIKCDSKDPKYKIITPDFDADTCPDGFLVGAANGEPVYDYNNAVLYDFEINHETKIELIKYIDDKYSTVSVSEKQFSDYINDLNNTEYYRVRIYKIVIKNREIISIQAQYEV